MGGFQWLSLEQVLNLRLVLPVKNGFRLLVPVNAFNYVFRYYIPIQMLVKQKRESLAFPFLVSKILSLYLIIIVAGTYLAKAVM